MSRETRTMSDTTSGFVSHTVDVALFRAVHVIPFARLKDIICTHYGAKVLNTELQRVQGTRNLSSCNLYLYVSITNRMGRKKEAIEEIMSVYRDIATECIDDDDDDDSTSASQTQAVVESADPLCRIEDATVGPLDESVTDIDKEDMNAYLEASRCTTTHSCCLEIGDMYDSSDYSSDSSDEECECDEVTDLCLGHDECCSITLVQGDLIHDGVCQGGIIEDETVVEKSKVIIDD